MSFQKLVLQSLMGKASLFISLIFVNIIFSRFLGAGAAGKVFYLTGILSVVVLTASFSMESAMGYFVANGTIPRNQLAWFSVGYTIIITILLYLIFHFFHPWKRPVFSENRLSFFSVVYVAGLILTNFFSGLFYAQKNFYFPNVILTIVNIALMILLATLWVNGYQVYNIIGAYFIFFLLQGIVLAACFIIKYKSWHELKLPTTLAYKKLFNYSFIAWIANFVFLMLYRVDYWFVYRSPVCNAHDLGNYMQAAKLGQMLLFLPQIFATVLFPQTAAKTTADRELHDGLEVISRLFLQLFVVLIFLVAIGGRLVFPVLFGPTFNSMHLPFLILLPGIFCLSMLGIFSAYFGGKGKVMINLRGAAIALVFVTIADGILVDQYGMIAAAIVSTLGYALNLTYSLYIFHKHYGLNIRSFFSFRKSDYDWVLMMFQKPNN